MIYILREIHRIYQNCFGELWNNSSDPGLKKCLALATCLSNLVEKFVGNILEFKIDFLLWMFPWRESELFISDNLFSIVGMGKLLNL